MALNRSVNPPVPPKRHFEKTLHGVTWQDPFDWMEPRNWRQVMQNPKNLRTTIRTHVEAERAYTAAVVKPIQPLIDKLVAEVRSRIPENDADMPYFNNNHWYHTAIKPGQKLPVLSRVNAFTGKKDLLLDPNPMAEKYPFYAIGCWEVSDDNKMLAYTYALSGGETFTLRVINIADGSQVMPDVKGVEANFEWGADCKVIYYLKQDEYLLPRKVYRRKINAPRGQDELVFEEKRPDVYLSISHTASYDYIVLTSYAYNSTEQHFVASADSDGEFWCFAPRVEGESYFAEDYGKGFLIQTNRGGAFNGKLCRVKNFYQHSRRNWRTFLPHRKNVMLKEIKILERFVVRHEVTADAEDRIVVYNRRNRKEHELKLPGKVGHVTLDQMDDRMLHSYLGIGIAPSYYNRHLRVMWSTPAQPPVYLTYNLSTNKRTVDKVMKVGGRHNPDNYVVRRDWATSHDGEKIPVTLCYHKDTPLDGTAPLWLYAYGAYSDCLEAYFRPERLTLIDRGFILALAHVRGGAEKTETWGKAGHGDGRHNTFKDFISVAEHCIAEKLTTAGNIYAEGRSAGGMLMAGVTNLRPDLWKVVHAGVPFVDVRGTMCNGTSGRAPLEWSLWGNPLKSTKALKSILSYCPYTNVKPQAYPHMVVSTGLCDSRVPFSEPMKYVAKLRENNTGNSQVLMHIGEEDGHRFGSSRYSWPEAHAFIHAIVLTHFGITE